ncbi:hypothetical protein N7519_002281 [Penicillium mononematosum]|uniref:uncharacterized protein n=1 Tax=Penicillium mononematosum TaxID=268346 RepID=UPI002546F5C4|nr:uncharacterized protein N7519_002281 [Penicillium mononematosum]KAJ6187373.1 hypothetical protein N7519_002281 [Penicillium mononematosum]
MSTNVGSANKTGDHAFDIVNTQSTTTAQSTTPFDEKTTVHTDNEKFDMEAAPEQEPSPEDVYRTASTVAPSQRSTRRDPVSRVTTDAEGNTYPEGGLEAWLVVLGSFLGLFGSLGLVNTIGTFQAYIQTHQLKEYSSGSNGWIFGMFAFLTFFCGVQVGPIFDARGPRLLVFAGSVFQMAMIILLGFCTEYWHFMLVIGVLGGVGATSSPKIGWAWATRVVALICLIVLSIANLLIRSRLPQKPFSKENVLPDFRIFRDPRFALTTASVFFIEWGLFVPISYISSYALDHGFPTKFSYQIIAILNAGSSFGRWLPGFFADFLGRFNTLIATVALCVLCNACLWLPAGDSLPLLVVYAALFGFSSGSNISLTPVCVGQLCKTENYGRYYATAYTIVSFGTLTGIPIAGEILARCNGSYWGLITFTVCCYAAGLACCTAVKVIQVGWRHPLAIY